jgi:hypothetical protein
MASLRLVRSQVRQELFINRWPLGAPLAQRPGVLKRTRPLFEQGQIVQRIVDLLLVAIAVGMPCDHLIAMQDLDPKGIRSQDQLPIGRVGLA